MQMGAVASTSTEVPLNTSNSDKWLHSAASPSCSSTGSKVSKSSGSSSHLIKPVLGSKSFVKKNVKQDSSSGSSSSASDNRKVDNDLGPSTSKLKDQTHNCTPKHEREGNEKESLVSSSSSLSKEMNSVLVNRGTSKPDFPSNCSNRTKSIVTKVDERSRSREKGDFSQSSKSSIGRLYPMTSLKH
ncbi:serine/threonine-protein kinase D6PKL1-like [Prunus yedoensis var. nudiflora]|uniref:Serine/threonine-protein kinase D6PKL1-like n=1 Tax=Prunus yedoensis var. nudiflora TaxID=2094558 RepID=A0A315AEF2_PRUYE|nr:serine/threonine-protein kinase D6PKL1-like [Prunus yedoensis var. nudiflora]